MEEVIGYHGHSRFYLRSHKQAEATSWRAEADAWSEDFSGQINKIIVKANSVWHISKS